MEKRTKPAMQFWDVVALSIVIPCALYFGMYALIVERGAKGVEISPGYAKIFVVAHYRWPWSSEVWNSEFGELVFRPANAIDRKLYPEKWTVNDRTAN